MKRRTTIITLSFVGFLIACHAVLWAQEKSLSSSKARRVAPAPQNRAPQGRGQKDRNRPTQAGQQKRRGGGPLMALLDADQDRHLSVAELKSAEARLKAYDTNKDGKWSAEELEQAHQKLKGEGGNRGRDQQSGQKRNKGQRQGQPTNNQRVTRPSSS